MKVIFLASTVEAHYLSAHHLAERQPLMKLFELRGAIQCGGATVFGSLGRRSTMVLGLLCAAAALEAQTSSSDPTGRVPLSIPAQHTSGQFTSSFSSLQFVRRGEFRGKPTSATLQSGSPVVLTFPAGTFVAGQFNATTALTYYVEVDNGQPTGTPGAWSYSGEVSNIASNTDSQLTLLDDALIPAVSVGVTRITIRPHWTIESLFGVHNSAGLQGGNTAGSADTVTVWDSTGTGATYFYRTTNSSWRIGASDATYRIVPPNRMMTLRRLGLTSLNIPLLGEPKTVGTRFLIPAPNAAGGTLVYSFLCNPYPKDSRPLSELGLYTGNSATGVVGSTSEETADVLMIFLPTVGNTSSNSINYYYHTGNQRWQLGNADASNARIPAGAAFSINRLAGSGATSFYWFMPPPSELAVYSH